MLAGLTKQASIQPNCYLLFPPTAPFFLPTALIMHRDDVAEVTPRLDWETWQKRRTAHSPISIPVRSPRVPSRQAAVGSCKDRR